MRKKGQSDVQHSWAPYIIAIVVLVILLVIAKNFAVAARIEEPVCRMSVMMRDSLSVNVVGNDIKLFPLECSTQTINVPLEPYPKSTTNAVKREIVEKDIAEKIAKCWWQFGEGTVSKNVFGTVFLGRDKCFVCYRVKIDEMPGTINRQELEHYLSTAKYRLTEKKEEICGNDVDDDGDTLPDQLDPDCKPGVEECVTKGGTCIDGCGSLEEVAEWGGCLEGKKCCADASKVVKYTDYIQQGGKIKITSDLVLEAKKDIYAITFISYTENSAETLARISPVGYLITEIFKSDPELQRIAVTRYNDIKDICNVRE